MKQRLITSLLWLLILTGSACSTADKAYLLKFDAEHPTQYIFKNKSKLYLTSKTAISDTTKLKYVSLEALRRYRKYHLDYNFLEIVAQDTEHYILRFANDTLHIIHYYMLPDESMSSYKSVVFLDRKIFSPTKGTFKSSDVATKISLSDAYRKNLKQLIGQMDLTDKNKNKLEIDQLFQLALTGDPDAKLFFNLPAPENSNSRFQFFKARTILRSRGDIKRE